MKDNKIFTIIIFSSLYWIVVLSLVYYSPYWDFKLSLLFGFIAFIPLILFYIMIRCTRTDTNSKFLFIIVGIIYVIALLSMLRYMDIYDNIFDGSSTPGAMLAVPFLWFSDYFITKHERKCR